jgi:hypothetical protein
MEATIYCKRGGNCSCSGGLTEWLSKNFNVFKVKEMCVVGTVIALSMGIGCHAECGMRGSGLVKELTFNHKEGLQCRVE